MVISFMKAQLNSCFTDREGLYELAEKSREETAPRQSGQTQAYILG